MPRKRKIAFDDTACARVDTDVGPVLVLFDSDDKPLYKLALTEANELIEEAGDEARRVQRLLYERAVTDGIIANPERQVSDERHA
jgi:hypothetical protein